MFKPLNTKQQSVYERVMQEIRSAVFSGELKPGEQLPPERELAEMLGVSRTSLREALKMLAAAGIVTIKHGQGVFVSATDPDQYIQGFADQIFMPEDRVADLFEIRRLLEPQAAAWAAQRSTPESAEELLVLVRKTREESGSRASGNLMLLAESDGKFHQRLAEMTGNQVLVRTMHHLLDLLTDLRALALSIPGRPVKSLEDHERIAECIANKDVDGARRAMEYHLEVVERDLSTKLGKEPGTLDQGEQGRGLHQNS